MTTEIIGVGALKNSATQIVRAVREEQVEYVITLHDRPVAVIRPFTSEDEERLRVARIEAHLAAVSALAAEIGGAWTSPKSGVEFVEEQRRG